MDKKGMGWVPDYPDVRDCTLGHDRVKSALNQTGSPDDEGTGDRSRQLLQLVKAIQATLGNTNLRPPSPNLEDLLVEFSQEVDRKLQFLPVKFVDGFLALGSTGKDVQELQEKLSKLNYLTVQDKEFVFNWDLVRFDAESLTRLADDSSEQPGKITDPSGQFDQITDPSGQFGEATALAVKAFQINQQLDYSGTYTAVTKAELLAIVSIVSRLGQSRYRPGISGPSILYIRALLCKSKYYNAASATDQPLDLFEQTMFAAVKAFQQDHGQAESKDATSISTDGTIDDATWKALAVYEDTELRNLLPRAPVPKRQFAALRDRIFNIITDSNANWPVPALIGRDNVIAQLGEQKADVNNDKLKQRLEPIVEVLIQLAPCLSDPTLSQCTSIENKLEAALRAGYSFLIKDFFDSITKAQLIDLSSASEPQCQRLTLLTNRLEQGRGFVSSNIFRNQTYQPGVSGPAITYIQERLRAMGYYNGPTTGYFDEQLTQAAIRRFQADAIERQLSPGLNDYRGDRPTQPTPPDGIVEQADIDRLLQLTKESITPLEPPLPDQLGEYVLNRLGNLAALHHTLAIDPTVIQVLANHDGRSARIEPKSLVREMMTALTQVAPASHFEHTDADTLQQLMQALQDPGTVDVEKQAALQQMLQIITRFALYPVVKVIAQLIAPISKYSCADNAFEDGIRRFKVLANFNRVQEIARILGGLVVNFKGDIDRLTHDYEPLIETLTTLKAEDRQLKRSITDVDQFAQLQTLVSTALHHASTTITVSAAQNQQEPQAPIVKHVVELLPSIQRWIITQLYVDKALYCEPRKQQSSSPPPTVIDQGLCTFMAEFAQRTKGNPLPRHQTFLRLDHVCEEGCAIQLPVVGQTARHLIEQTQQNSSVYLVLPNAVDLSLWCSEVKDQGSLDACTANAAVGLVEYFEKKSFGSVSDASRRFLYKVTRNLMHRDGDTGASVRETMKAMVLFGVPPEEYCPYDEAKFDEDPSAFCYAFAQNYQAITYVRLDSAGMPTHELLAQIKTMLVGGFPCMFGFTIYDSIYDRTNPPGQIPYPTMDDKQMGGHAAIAVGYNDYKQIRHTANPGALLIKNSWGTDWGEGGYGWLPYDYVLNGLARDWWSLIKSEWVESKQFGLNPVAWTTNLGATLTSGTTIC